MDWLSVYDFAASCVTRHDTTSRERWDGSAPRWPASDWWHRSIVSAQSARSAARRQQQLPTIGKIIKY
jgi:hypothetical protein